MSATPALAEQPITVRVSLTQLTADIAGAIETVLLQKGIGLVASSGHRIRRGDEDPDLNLEKLIAEISRNCCQHVACAEVE